MKCRTILTIGLVSLIGFSASSWSYDADLAQSYAKLFEPVAGAKSGKALHLMPPEIFMKGLQANKPIVTIDVATPNESSVLSTTLPGSMSIPVNKIFLKENLDRIPQDKVVVIVCKSGSRAIAVTTALRHVGFKNVYALKGGIMALSKYLSAKTANPPPKKAMMQ